MKSPLRYIFSASDPARNDIRLYPLESRFNHVVDCCDEQRYAMYLLAVPLPRVLPKIARALLLCCPPFTLVNAYTGSRQ